METTQQLQRFPSQLPTWHRSHPQTPVNGRGHRSHEYWACRSPGFERMYKKMFHFYIYPGFRDFLVGRTSLEGQPQDHSMMIQDGRDGVKDKLKMGCADVHHTDLYLISSFVTTKLWVATPHPLWPWVPAHGPVLKDRHSVAPRRMGQSTPRLCVGSKFFRAVESQRSQLSACR